MLVGMASEISKKNTYKCVNRSRHNGIKSGMTKLMCALRFLPTLHFGNVFGSCSFTFLVITLATTVYALVEEGTVR